jgi:hypothetical protein
MNALMNSPKQIVETGERVYREKFQTAFEATHSGEYVAIDVEQETAYLGITPEEAFDAARKGDPQGVFHLVRVGYAAAFQLSYQYGRYGESDWLFG